MGFASRSPIPVINGNITISQVESCFGLVSGELIRLSDPTI